MNILYKEILEQQ